MNLPSTLDNSLVVFMSANELNQQTNVKVYETTAQSPRETNSFQVNNVPLLETREDNFEHQMSSIATRGGNDTNIESASYVDAGFTSEVHEEWIDRTNEPLGEIGNGYELTPTLQTLCLTNNRLKKIEHLEPCINITELVLRQNTITVVEGLQTLRNLVDLDLYMNAITRVPSDAFSHNPNLQKLDLSFNQLRTLESFPSRNLANLRELYLIGNKIKKIVPLPGMPQLKMLELGDNRIRDIENLDELANLEELWLGRNKIAAIRNIESLHNLRKLSLQSNRITVIERLSHLTSLEELYLSHNGLISMKGIEELRCLVLLDLGTNEISHISGVDKLPRLKEFWFNNNKLETTEDLKLLSSSENLETVYLEGNPIAQDQGYYQNVLNILPDSLEQLDAMLVSDVRREMSQRRTGCVAGSETLMEISDVHTPLQRPSETHDSQQ